MLSIIVAIKEYLQENTNQYDLFYGCYNCVKYGGFNMYSIDYFKTKRNKPKIKETEYNSENRLHNYKRKKVFILKKFD